MIFHCSTSFQTHRCNTVPQSNKAESKHKVKKLMSTPDRQENTQSTVLWARDRLQFEFNICGLIKNE